MQCWRTRRHACAVMPYLASFVGCRIMFGLFMQYGVRVGFPMSPCETGVTLWAHFGHSDAT
eukprot:4273363-Pyramimonas_sp.AAC.1